MTRLLIGLTGGLYTFDLPANCSPRSVLLDVQPIAFATDPSEFARVYCATYNRGLWRSEDAGETWLPVGTSQRFFERSTGGSIELRETTFVSVDPVSQVGFCRKTNISSGSKIPGPINQPPAFLVHRFSFRSSLTGLVLA